MKVEVKRLTPGDSELGDQKQEEVGALGLKRGRLRQSAGEIEDAQALAPSAFPTQPEAHVWLLLLMRGVKDATEATIRSTNPVEVGGAPCWKWD